MAFARVALKFARFSDPELQSFAETIINGLTGNANFPTPPVTLIALAAHTADFANKIADANVGGPAATAAKNVSRQVLLGDLQQLALYVELEANGGLDVLLTSGFEARSTERQSLPLEKPVELTLTNDGDGALNASVKAVKNCSMYEGRAKVDGSPDWMESIFAGDSEHIRFTGLTPGTLYSVQIRALGGSTGTSDWSDPAQHRSL